jgi:hypothetical protein
MTAPPLQTSRPRGLDVPTATTVAAAALTLGVVADTLFHDGPGPVSFAIGSLLVAVTLVAIVWRSGRALPRESGAWLFGAVLFASLTAWRNAEILQALDTVAALGCLVLAAVRLRDPRNGVLAERWRDTVAAAVSQFVDVAVGIFPLVLREVAARGIRSQAGARLHRILRPALFVALILLVFGSLLRSADPIFASLATLPRLDVEDIFAHVVIIAFFTVVIAGWARSALLPEPTRFSLGAGYGFSLGATDIITILGTLNVLFGAFVLAQLGWFFGGEEFLRARTGLTVAEYARGGFFQILWIVALVVPVLVVTRGALEPERRLARRHTALAIPIIVLLAAMIVGAIARLNLYVKYYGFTTDRLYPLVFMGWLFATLLWLTVTVLRDWSRPFVIGAALSAAATLFTLNALDPDAFVARVNVARAHHAPASSTITLDVEYLATLSGGAVPYAVDAVLAPPPSATPHAYDDGRCAGAERLLARYGPSRKARGPLPTDVAAPWRYWNADDAKAVAVVRAHARQLLETRHQTCAAARQAAPAGSGAAQR